MWHIEQKSLKGHWTDGTKKESNWNVSQGNENEAMNKTQGNETHRQNENANEKKFFDFIKFNEYNKK